MSEEKKFDWRLQAVITFSKNQTLLGSEYSKGDYGVVIGDFLLKGEKINFDMPNFCALYLDMANNHFQNIDSNYFTFKNFENGRPKNHNKFFILIQNRISNIVFSFLGLEAFINDTINFIDNYDKNYRYSYIDEKGIKREKGIKYIVKKFTIENKLKVIYDFYNIEENTTVKNNIMKIKKIRNKLIHFNPHIKISYKSGDKVIWNDLLDINFINYSIFVNDIIGYFIKNSGQDKPISQYWYKRSDNCFK